MSDDDMIQKGQNDLIRRGDAVALCDRYPYVEGVKSALQDLPAVTVGVRPQPTHWWDFGNGAALPAPPQDA